MLQLRTTHLLGGWLARRRRHVARRSSGRGGSSGHGRASRATRELRERIRDGRQRRSSQLLVFLLSAPAGGKYRLTWAILPHHSTAENRTQDFWRCSHTCVHDSIIHGGQNWEVTRLSNCEWIGYRNVVCPCDGISCSLKKRIV